jgi:hypothetical protein
MRATTVFSLFLLVAVGVAACGGDDPAGGDAGTDGGADGSSDADGDSDADTDEACAPEVFDDGTNLYWLQCLAGQCWDGAACAWEDGVDPVSLTFAEASEACPSGYRLPAIDELMGLMDDCTIDLSVDEPGTCTPCQDSDTCNAIFPGIGDLPITSIEIIHWSSTDLETSDARAWWMNFQSGVVESRLKEMPGGTAVCVRDP